MSGRSNFPSVPGIAAVCIVLAHAALVLHGAARHSAVFDEVVYPTAGYSYLTTGDYRLNQEHPPFLKLWTALPWIGSGLDPRAAPGWRVGDEWSVGPAMIYADPPSAGRLLMRARFMVAILSVLAAVAVFASARRFAGSEAGLLALVLYAFDPLVVAHAGFATTDVGTAALFFVAAMAFPGVLSRGGARPILAAGLALGLALASKFSAVLLLVVLAAVALREMLSRGRAAGAPAIPAGRLAARTLAPVLVAFAVVAASYGPNGPSLYFTGFDLLRGHAELGHPTYAFGQYSMTGWWWYFPAAWAVKTPIPILLASSAGLLLAASRSRIRGTEGLVVVLAPLLVAATAVASPLNLGVRHVLPATPFLAVLGGVALSRAWTTGRVAARVVVLAILVWLVAGTLAVHPDETAYSNELAGGSSNTWKHLADSNVDWGQDLPALAAEVGRQPLRRLYLGYFGTADPAAHGLRYTWIPSMRMIDRRYEEGPDPDGREWIAMSVTNLLEVDSPTRDNYAWLRERPFTAFPGKSIALFDVTGDADAHARLARIAMRYADWETALAPMRRAVELRPSDRELRADLDRILSKRGAQ
jgi:hypothetical protein